MLLKIVNCQCKNTCGIMTFYAIVNFFRHFEPSRIAILYMTDAEIIYTIALYNNYKVLAYVINEHVVMT